MEFNANTARLVDSVGPLAVVLSGFAVGAVVWRAWPFFRRAVGRGAPEGMEPSDGRARYDAFDGLRGVLCLLVLIHHVEITRHLNRIRGDWLTAVERAPAVLLPRDVSTALFFAMTAFLFYARTLERPRPLNVPDFLGRRAWRLGPALIVSMLLMFAVELLPTSPHMMSLSDAGKIAVKCLTLGAVGPSMFPQNAGVLWTLSYEWMFYLAFPILAAAVVGGASTTVRVLGCVAAASFAAGTLGRANIVMAYPAGIIAAHLHNLPAVRRLASHWGGSVVIVLLGVGITVGASHLQHRDLMPFIIAAGCGMFTLVAAGNDVFGLLRLPAVRAVGIASYSVYLFHGIALYALRPLVIAQAAEGRSQFVAYATLCAITAGVVVLSCVSYRYVEHLGVEMGRRAGGRKKARPAAVPPAPAGDAPAQRAVKVAAA